MPTEPATPHLSRVPELLRDFGWQVPTRLTSRYTRVHGLPLHSRSGGRAGGIPFILLHGLVISSLYMVPLAEVLAVSHPVHALDLPGFGRSTPPRRILSLREMAQAALAWMDERGIERCHLMGNSLGCEIVAHLAVLAPERVVTCTFVGPTLDPDNHAVITQTLRLLRDALHEPKRLWLNWAYDFLRTGPARALGTTREMFEDHIEHQLPRVQAPTLVLRGEHDPTVPQAAAETLTSLLPRGELLVMRGEWHCAHFSAPQAVAGHMLSFIQRHRTE